MERRSDAVQDVEIGLELNRALVTRNGDAAATALADYVRAHHMRISEEAWRFLEYAVKSQWTDEETR